MFEDILADRLRREEERRVALQQNALATKERAEEMRRHSAKYLNLLASFAVASGWDYAGFTSITGVEASAVLKSGQRRVVLTVGRHESGVVTTCTADDGLVADWLGIDQDRLSAYLRSVYLAWNS